MNDDLPPMQQLFVDEYLLDLNATAAARRAGYKQPHVQGPRLLGNVRVAAAIAAAQSARSQSTGITAARVLQELARIALLDIRGFYRSDGTLKFPHELNDDQAAALASLEVLEEFDGSGEDRYKVGEVRKVKFWDKPRALQMLAQHLGMLVEKHEHTGKDGGPIQHTHDLSDSELDTRIAELESRIPDAARRTGSPSGS